MKKLILIFAAFLLAAIPSFAISQNHNMRFADDRSFIFNENGITFSVFHDGQFDFYLNSLRGPQAQVNINIPGINISFNSGYNYDPYVQYDDYGAVIQVENTAVYYDHFGRISRAGNVNINYNHLGLITQVGGLNIHYDPNGFFLDCSGQINAFTVGYAYRPYRQFFSVPVVSRCIVYNQPYRRYYRPRRCSYTVYQRNYGPRYYNRTYRNRTYHRPNDRVANYRRGNTSRNPGVNRNHGVRNQVVSRPATRQRAYTRSNTTLNSGRSNQTINRSNRGNRSNQTVNRGTSGRNYNAAARRSATTTVQKRTTSPSRNLKQTHRSNTSRATQNSSSRRRSSTTIASTSSSRRR